MSTKFRLKVMSYKLTRENIEDKSLGLDIYEKL